MASAEEVDRLDLVPALLVAGVADTYADRVGLGMSPSDMASREEVALQLEHADMAA